MKSIKDMDIGELAAFVCSHLLRNGVKCVLTGGACVSIYTNNSCISYDLDFIEIALSKSKSIKKIMSEIGFYPENRYYKHIETKLFIEFPSGPLAIGSQPVKKFSEKKFPTGILHLLSPTDCVKDRLAAFYYWNDLQSLDQAIKVSEQQKIDIKEIEKWSFIENQSDKFNKIKIKLTH